MARYDVYRAPNGELAAHLLDVQADVLEIVGTRVVVPLFRRRDYAKPAAILHPVFDIEGVPCVMVTHLIGTVSQLELGRPVTNLAAEHFTIIAALDKLLTGT